MILQIKEHLEINQRFALNLCIVNNELDQTIYHDIHVSNNFPS